MKLCHVKRKILSSNHAGYSYFQIYEVLLAFSKRLNHELCCIGSSRNIAENDNLGVDSYAGQDKVHPSAPQIATTPLGTRGNQLPSNRESATTPGRGPHVVIDFEEGIAPVTENRGSRIPQRRTNAESPRRFRKTRENNKENQ